VSYNLWAVWEMSKKNKIFTTIFLALEKRTYGSYSFKIRPQVNTGFTLTELIIAIAILSIVVAVAAPTYNNYIQQGKIAEALSTLGNLSTQMEKYYLDFRVYTNNQGNCAINNLNGDTYSYSCTSTGQNYTWTATSSDGNYVFSVNNHFDKATLAFKGNTLSSVDCWMVSEDGCI